MCPQMTCLRGYKVTLVTFDNLFRTVYFVRRQPMCCNCLTRKALRSEDAHISTVVPQVFVMSAPKQNCVAFFTFSGAWQASRLFGCALDSATICSKDTTNYLQNMWKGIRSSFKPAQAYGHHRGGKNNKLAPICVNCGSSLIKMDELKRHEIMHNGASF